MNNRLLNEDGEGFVPGAFDRRSKELAEDAAKVAALEAEYESYWNRENTIACRIAWNGYMAAEKAAGRLVNLGKAEEKFGFSLATLKAAIARHELS